eukprot:4588223-Pleurochrysis_carterae.AAC.4
MEKQVAKRKTDQSTISYAIDFLNAVGVHNDTVIVVEVRFLEVHCAAKMSMDWTSGSAQSVRRRFTISSTACTTMPIKTRGVLQRTKSVNVSAISSPDAPRSSSCPIPVLRIYTSPRWAP